MSDTGSMASSAQVPNVTSADAAIADIRPSAPDAGTQTGIGGIATTPMQPAATPDPHGPDADADADAGAPEPSNPAKDPVRPPAPATNPTTIAAGSCSRETLQKHATAYLQAMNSGDLEGLNLHPQVRYTENGQTQMLGLGLWLSRPETEFARHVLDEARCSAITVAVLKQPLQRIVFGVRLRYVEEQLLEVEAQVVTRNLSYYDPDALIPTGADPWIEPVADAARMSRDALMHLAERYFESATDASLLPAHAPGCKRRQNGTLLSGSGSCAQPAGDERFEQRRFPVIDETAGVVTAIVYYRNYVGMYLFKAQSDTVQNIDVIGGAQTANTGW